MRGAGARSGRASLQIRREVLLQKGESIAKVRFKFFFRPQTHVTGSRKRGHFAQKFKIELLVLKGRVALKQ